MAGYEQNDENGTLHTEKSHAFGYEVGVALPKLVTEPVTKTQLVMYSGASGDFNPIHTVDEYAKEAGLGGVIAHGMLTMAFVGRMLTDVIGRRGTLESFGVRFKEMVRPGDTVTCEGKVTKMEETEQSVRLHCDVWATTPPDRVVVAGTAQFSLPR